MMLNDIDMKIRSLEFESFAIKYSVNTSPSLDLNEINKLISDRLVIKNEINSLKNKRKSVIKNMVRKEKLLKIIKNQENC